MWRLLYGVLSVFLVLSVSGYNNSLCDSSTRGRKTLSCSTQILGREIQQIENDICKMELYPANSGACTSMPFADLEPHTNIGGVTLTPYMITVSKNDNLNPFTVNHTVLNITFSNIKWTSMRFRFQDSYNYGNLVNHCRHINISKDAPIDDRSVLYYDCYWSRTGDLNNQRHMLDFEAYGDGVVNRGQYVFNLPTAEMLSPVAKEVEWKPFMYIEIFPDKMRLHILPPPERLKITAYRIVLMKGCGKGGCELQSTTKNLINRTDTVTYDYKHLGSNGLYYFSVTPLHASCVLSGERCTVVDSPKINISSESQSVNICIASVTALIVATLFAYYIALRAVRRYWCKDYKRAANEIPLPPKVLLIYSPANRLHAECVISFVTFLRTEYGIDVLYDGDISSTTHADPYIWAEEAFRISSHVVYIVGPVEQVTQSIYDKPIITAHKDVDVLLLSFIKASRSRYTKEIVNVRFEHSNGQIPVETRHDKVYSLLKDWQKLIAFLSTNLLPKQQIMMKDTGKKFMHNLTQANKLLRDRRDDVIVKCDKPGSEKILL